MPALGSVVANGFVESQVRGAIVADKNRNARRSPTTARISRETALYIYSVGCFMESIPRGDKGTLIVFGVAQHKCLLPNDLTVGPAAILEGIPSTTYPTEGGGMKWIDSVPPAGIGYDDDDGFHLFEEEAGYYEALVTIGAGPLSQPTHDMRRKGLFVSKFPEQKRPTPPVAPKANASAREIVAYEREKEQYDAALKMFDKWKAQVIDAKEHFTQYCRDTVQEGNEALSAGVWSKIKQGPGKGEPFITCARLLHYTEVEAPFLKDTVEVAQRKLCMFCGSTMLSDKIICAACGKVQDRKALAELTASIA